MEIYTPFAEARKLISERFANKELREKVLAHYKDVVPGIMIDKPHAVLSRPIATPNFEFEHFLKLADETGLPPLVLEYPDKFVAKNESKYHLCKLCILDVSKNNHDVIVSRSPVDFNVWEGKSLSKITTKNGHSLVNQHHDLLFEIHPNMRDRIYDFSDWFKKTRGIADDDYYVAYFSLFVCFGILFDNYLVNDASERNFILTKVVPGFEKVEKLFGVKPIICALLPLGNEQNSEWYCYEKKINPIIEKVFT